MAQLPWQPHQAALPVQLTSRNSVTFWFLKPGFETINLYQKITNNPKIKVLKRHLLTARWNAPAQSFTIKSRWKARVASCLSKCRDDDRDAPSTCPCAPPSASATRDDPAKLLLRTYGEPHGVAIFNLRIAEFWLELQWWMMQNWCNDACPFIFQFALSLQHL